MFRIKQIKFNKEWMFSILSVILATIYMPIFLYSTNSGEVDFSETLLPIGIFLLIAMGIFSFSVLITKSPVKAGLIGCIFILFLENYRYFEKGIQWLVPYFKYWHVLPIGIFVLLHVCYLICRIFKEDIKKIMVMTLCMVLGGLTVVNLLGAIPNIISKINVTEKEEEQILIGSSVNNDGANIYYFLLDEAAPFNVMETLYESDMTEFREFFEENNFMISEDSYNESYYTKVVLTNLLNLDYIANDSTSDAQIAEFRKSKTLDKVLEETGYTLLGVGDTSGLYIDSVTENRKASAETMDGKNFVQTVMGTTFLYPLFEKNYVEAQEVILDTFNYFYEDIYNTHSQFTFAYLNCPHAPFLFDENGNNNPGDVFTNWEDEKYYLGQYKYVIKQVQKTVKHIIESDPNSIIIVASDHGPRFNSEMNLNSEKVKNVLQAVYYKGENIEDMSGLSSVNTLRSVLSKQLGIELPLVEVP